MRYDIVSIVDTLKPLHFLRSVIWKYFVTFWSIKKEGEVVGNISENEVKKEQKGAKKESIYC